MSRIAFSWNGLPQFAARLIHGAICALNEDCIVLGSKPAVPVEGMERALGRKIIWLDANKPARWRDYGLSVPQIFVQQGWAYPAFSALGAEVKRLGGRVIGLSDSNWRGDLRQLVFGPLAFHLHYLKHFDAMVVPGCRGERVMRWFGMPSSRVRRGMLGADPALFKAGQQLEDRPKRFLYIGQFIERKNVLGLCRAFLRFANAEPGWTLHLCGGGEQRHLIQDDQRIVVEDFIQPEELSKRYQQARFFVLPSLFEPWGVVVHEAALSGCGLILSDRVGSSDDLCNAANGIRFRAKSEDGLVEALFEAAHFDSDRLLAVSAESSRLAAQFGPTRFGCEVASLVKTFST